MSLVLLETEAPPWVAGLIALIVFMTLLAIVRGIGKSNPHS